MSKAIFNRNDPKVKADALILPKEQFIKEYLAETTASKVVLESIWKTHARERDSLAGTSEKTNAAIDFPTPSKKALKEEVEIPDEIEDELPEVTEEVDALINGALTKGKKEKKATPVKEQAEGADKPGRTPRMRELMKELDKDKQKVRKVLEEEGFNCSGSGFHSEWNRVAKSIK
jgi:hypothetical protein